MTEPASDTRAEPREASRPRFSARERRILEALLARSMPPGPRLPATAQELRFVERLEDFFAEMPAYTFRGFRSMIWTLDRGAVLKTLRPFSRLSPEAQERYLQSLAHSRLPYLRISLKLVLAVLKLVRYSLPDVLESFGYRAGAPRPLRSPPLAAPHANVREGRRIEGEVRVDADVVVIGTGAGGAVVGKELGELGRKVVFLEEGDYYTKSDFNRRPIEMSRLMYREAGTIAALGRPGVLLPLGRTVGGTTTINSGTCFRVPDEVLARWQTELGLPFTPEAMGPYFDKVEEAIHVVTPPRELWGKVAEVIARGADALGYHHGPLRRNVRDCAASGVCAFGCPRDAKQSMQVSYVPRALDQGAVLFTGTRADRLLVEDGRVLGVVGRTRGGGRVVVRARAVVVACGTLLTPVLLQRNGLCRRSGQLGRNLTVHPATKVMGLFEEEIRGWEGIPQGYQIDHFRGEGLLYEGASVPPDFGSLGLTFLGKRFAEVMEQYDRLAIFGFLVADTTRGTVRPGPNSVPLVVYNLNREDTRRIVRGLAILCRVFFAAGARSVFPSVTGFEEIPSLEGVDRFERARVSAWDLEVAAFHPLGTARMGMDPESSVVGPEFEAHDVRGLYVVDGSIFPTSLGVNPQVTIMAFATLAAEKIAARL
jgi:choline dehydrogenase-like flavoprotein